DLWQLIEWTNIRWTLAIWLIDRDISQVLQDAVLLIGCRRRLQQIWVAVDEAGVNALGDKVRLTQQRAQETNVGSNTCDVEFRSDLWQLIEWTNIRWTLAIWLIDRDISQVLQDAVLLIGCRRRLQQIWVAVDEAGVNALGDKVRLTQQRAQETNVGSNTCDVEF